LSIFRQAWLFFTKITLDGIPYSDKLYKILVLYWGILCRDGESLRLDSGAA
jgi:hypothetical protein